MEQNINELVEILTTTEGITYVTYRVEQGKVCFSFFFDSYQVFNLLDKAIRIKSLTSWTRLCPMSGV